MSCWNRNIHKPTADAAESLSYAPSGGRAKMWLLGFFLALVPSAYGARCLLTGHATFFGRRGSHLELDGDAAISLAIAYIAVGAFIHAHWFWGLHPRLVRFSSILKTLALLVFLGSFGWTVFKVLGAAAGA